MKEITVTELKSRLDNGDTIQIIDIREEHELHFCTIGGQHLPMADVLDSTDKIRTDCDVVIHCRTGSRAEAVCVMLESKHGFENIYNLKGGIMAWAEEVDPKMEQY